MKAKFTILLLAAALTLPAVAQNKVRTNPVAPVARALKAAKAPTADVPAGYASVTLTVGDVWGDGTGYQMLLDADASVYGVQLPVSGPLATESDVSDDIYALFEYKIPENADGALATSNFLINESVTILIPAGIYDWCITNPTPGESGAMWIANSGRADDYEFEDGVSYVFEPIQQGTGDYVTITITDPNAPTMPEDVTVEPQATSAFVFWTDNDDNVWNLRYRPFTQGAGEPFFCDFEDDTQLEGWRIYDADGDGYNWGYAQTSTSGYILSSASYENYVGALTPDNWLISPTVMLGGTLKFDAWGQDPSWAAEHFAVYVCENPEWESIDEFVQLSDELIATGTQTTYEFDLSNYEGEGCIAIRHFNVTDMFRLNVDNFGVYPASAGEEWIVVENLNEPQYNIEGLTPETTYEVQVQAGRNVANAPARAPRLTAWTESVVFTTTAEEDPTAIVDVNSEVETSNVWYNMAGMKLNGKPVENGIYIHNGKKVVVK